MLEGTAKTAADLQLMGYFFLLVAAYFVCGLTSGPHLKAWDYQPVISPESILIALGLGFFALTVSHYVQAKAKK